MARDILVNTNTGDFIVPQHDAHESYYEVLWGKLFDGDSSEYMNIVVPTWAVGRIAYEDNRYECLVHASYYPVDSTFQIRFVFEGNDGYVDASTLNANIPVATTAVYYSSITDNPTDLLASQLPMIDVNGYFKIVFMKYDTFEYTRAIVYQADDADFSIGDSDNQSAQLLARCAPGSYYRFPGLGVDLTKYINSVVDHTRLTESLVNEYKSDYKTVTEAEFDNTTGDLKVQFSGTRVADDDNLTDPNLLDLELLRVADDEYIRTLYKLALSTESNNEEAIQTMTSFDNFFGIYDIGSECKLGTSVGEASSHYYINSDGRRLQDDSTKKNGLATMKVEAGNLYALNYDFTYHGNDDTTDSMMTYDEQADHATDEDENGNHYDLPTWSHDPLFALYDSDDNVQYIDQPFYCAREEQRFAYGWSFSNRRMFIPLVDMTMWFMVGANYVNETTLSVNGYKEGIYLVPNEKGNFASVLGIALDRNNGKLIGVVTNDSLIEDAKINTTTNELLIIKRTVE